MAFNDYTTPDSVRAILGVSVKEVRDVAIQDNVYLTALLEALYEIHEDLPADYLAMKEVEPPSAAQARMILLADTYCAYVVAREMVPKMPIIAPQTITDGKAEVARVANPFEMLLPAINASLSTFKLRLNNAYAAFNSEVTVASARQQVNLLIVGLGTDPVTG